VAHRQSPLEEHRTLSSTLGPIHRLRRIIAKHPSPVSTGTTNTRDASSIINKSRMLLVTMLTASDC